MNTVFYKAWLPLSLAFHVVLLFTLNIVPFSVPRFSGDRIIPITIIDPLYAAPKTERAEVVRPAPLPVVKPATTSSRINADALNQPILPKNVPPGNQSIDPSITTGNATKPGNDTINKEKGPGIGAKAPPAIMRARNGTGFDAPPGVSGSMGTGGSNEVGVSGPSYGAKAKYGRVDGMSKLAAEVLPDGPVSAIFTVRVSETGNISSVSMTKGTGNSDVDREASEKVRARQYVPAMKNGKTVADTVRVKVEYKNGRYTVEEM